MREIKFRAWDSERRQMSWPFTLHCTPTWELSDGGYTLDDDKFEAAPIMQFTGLKDCGGIEIYEGDILRCGEHVGLVEWNGIRLKPFSYLSGIDISHGARPHYTSAGTTIIGNIHENPELLKD